MLPFGFRKWPVHWCHPCIFSDSIYFSALMGYTLMRSSRAVLYTGPAHPRSKRCTEMRINFPKNSVESRDWVSCLDCCSHCCPHNNNDVPLTALQCWSAYLRYFVKLTMVTKGFSGPCLTAALTSQKLLAKCAAYRMQVRTPTALRHSTNAAYPLAAERLRLHPLQNLPELSSRKEVEPRTLVEAH